MRVSFAAALFCAGAEGFLPPSTPMMGVRTRLPAAMATRRQLYVSPVVATATMPTSPSVNKAAIDIDLKKLQFSGLNGMPLEKKEFPNKKEVMQAIPEKRFKRNTLVSLMYAAISTALTLSRSSNGHSRRANL